MKRLTILLSMMILTVGMSAQKMDFWLDAGLKVQTGFTALYNANATSGNRFDNTLASGTKYGGKLGLNFGYIGVSFDVMTGSLNSKFQGRNSFEDREINVSVTDLYVLFRSARHKGYFEIGPKLSFIGNVDDGSSGPELDDRYEDKNLGAVLGFGTYLLGPEGGRFSGIFGLRLEYGFQDLVNADGRVEGDTRQPVPYTGDAASTNPIFVGVVFEFNWGIGGVGQARCGERSKFIWF